MSARDQLFEYIMLSLRLERGIVFEEFRARFGFSFEKRFSKEITQATTQGLARIDGQAFHPTIRGFDLQNFLIGLFLNKL